MRFSITNIYIFIKKYIILTKNRVTIIKFFRNFVHSIEYLKLYSI